jgi:hypothetical protein
VRKKYIVEHWKKYSGISSSLGERFHSHDSIHRSHSQPRCHTQRIGLIQLRVNCIRLEICPNDFTQTSMHIHTVQLSFVEWAKWWILNDTGFRWPNPSFKGWCSSRSVARLGFLDLRLRFHKSFWEVIISEALPMGIFVKSWKTSIIFQNCDGFSETERRFFHSLNWVLDWIGRKSIGPSLWKHDQHFRWSIMKSSYLFHMKSRPMNVECLKLISWQGLWENKPLHEFDIPAIGCDNPNRSHRQIFEFTISYLAYSHPS